MPLLSESLESRAEGLRVAFDGARPFRHVVIDGFLSPEFCRRLQADFPSFDARHARNEMGQVGGKAVRPDLPSLSAAYAELDAMLQTPSFLALVGRITGIDALLYDPDYVGGGTHENLHGQGLAPHVDFNHLPRTGWHRRLNLILYLNDEWSAGWGGCLDLHSDPWDASGNQVTRVMPAFNRCVVFETNEHSWHGFEAIDLPDGERHRTRRSVAIYLYTRERDAAESVPGHGTVYVPPGLPSGIAAGRLLSKPDVEELQRRFTQLRGQLKFLYQRELETSGQLDGLAAALDEARAAVAFPLQGYQWRDGPVRGYWPDGWAGPRLSAGFRLGRPSAGLKLRLWVPEQLPQDPTITVRANGSEQALAVTRGQTHDFDIDLDVPAGGRLDLEIISSESFVPRDSEASPDDRCLAYRVVSAVLA